MCMPIHKRTQVSWAPLYARTGVSKPRADPTGGQYGVSDHKVEVDNFVRVMKMSYEERNAYTEENGKNQSKARHIMAKMPNYGRVRSFLSHSAIGKR